ncbi:Flagellar motility protein MotE, a chaperone for MotC folding [Yoonia litorea]|uniref:Flagellar motility protein MotE, a chaperone for MotC folding n=2 Tax=Yoonia litorea TaxID=1123755 RepID=A0A1I6MUD8_9RHOB|nr:Flagellar motility protein MotE, a chaperone for MotC folding [Yoonia litorea]
MTTRKTASPRKFAGVLRTIILMLIVSAAARFAVQTGPAIAAISETSKDDATEGAPLQDGLLSALQDRERALSQRETALGQRLAAIEEAEAALQEKLAELSAAEEALLSTIAMAETAASTDIAQLTTVYENMKPKEAAALFSEMSPDFAAGFLALMRPDTAAAIMTELDPIDAYAFSVVLAGRNADEASR